MEWKFINEEQRQQLKIALEIIKNTKKEINPNFKEYALVTTSEYAIEDAIEKERIHKVNLT